MKITTFTCLLLVLSTGTVHGRQHRYHHRYHTSRHEEEKPEPPKVKLLTEQKPLLFPAINGSTVLDAFSGRMILEYLCHDNTNFKNLSTADIVRPNN